MNMVFEGRRSLEQEKNPYIRTIGMLKHEYKFDTMELVFIIEVPLSFRYILKNRQIFSDTNLLYSSYLYGEIKQKTRPDTRLPQSRAGGQGPQLRSPDHLGRSSEAKNHKKTKK